jgi:two-component sensor histidine kinase
MQQTSWDKVRRFSEVMLLNGGRLGPGARLVFAAAAVGGAFAIRYLLDPLFGSDRFVFSSFYLAVIAIAFVAGVVPALIASVTIAPLAYWAFAEPGFAWKSNNAALAAIYFYVLTCAMNIMFIALLKKVLADNQQRREAAEVQAEGHAALFREFNARSAHHLQLVAALLDALAKDDRDGKFSHVVADTSNQTLAIARLHRTMDGGQPTATDITAFAKHMLTAGLEPGEAPAITVKVIGDPLILPAELATSVAVILLEYQRALMLAKPAALTLRVDAAGRVLTLTAAASDGSGVPVGLDDRFSRDIVRAALQQLNGALVDSALPGVTHLRLALPLGDGRMLAPELSSWAAQAVGPAN